MTANMESAGTSSDTGRSKLIRNIPPHRNDKANAVRDNNRHGKEINPINGTVRHITNDAEVMANSRTIRRMVKKIL